MIEKHGDLRPDSKGDIDLSKKAEYIDEDGLKVASEEDKHLLKNPTKIDFNKE